ncbi:MAG: DUF5017 domain-containing protein [Bacteroidetes bacterium]|nr:DUF5017 domain-containing protein [Bacteroidota bacterium]
MKKFTFISSLIVVFLLFINNDSIADIYESFDGWSDGSYGTVSTYNSPTTGNWETYNSMCHSDNALSGNAIRFNDDSGENEYLLYTGLDGNGKDGGVGTISFWYRHWDGDGSPVQFQVQYKQGAGSWTNAGPVIDVTSTTYLEFSQAVNVLGDDISVQVISIDDAERLLIDDFTITDYSGGGNVPPSITNIVQTPYSGITSSTTVSVSADVTDPGKSITNVELHWGTTSGSLGTTINMSNTGGDTYTTDTDIPAQADGTTVYYEIAATDDEPETTTSPEQSYTVTDPATTTLTYSETFDVGFGDCYTYSVAGIKTWYYFSGGQMVSMNGYGGDNPEEDWLILPGINFDNYSNEVMTFTTYARYGTNNENNYLKLYYSTDYFEIGDPSSSNWTELTYIQPTGINDDTEVSAFSGNIDLSGITGSSIYIAFKYYSTDSPTRWSVDDILIGEALSWYNLQWPGTPDPMPSWWNLTVYAQCWEPGVTDAAGQGAGIECWIGYSLVDENPEGSTNFTWVQANYDSDQGSNDQYSTNLGADIPMAPGTYYYVARWSFNGGPYTFGGFQGGAWNGTTNVSGVLTIDPSAATCTWTGTTDNNWFDAGNWDNGVPGYNTDATIPVGLTTYPLTTAGTAMCNNLLVQSDVSGDGSIIEYGNLNVIGTATVEKYISSDVYHSYSPSVSGLTAGIFHLPGSTGLDVYLYSHNELNNGDAFDGYFEIVDVSTPLIPMAGYAVYVDGINGTPPVTGWTFNQQGSLNSGSFGMADNMTRTGTGAFAGFNYVGNPYPSFIDWDAATGWNKTQMNATTWIENGGGWAMYTPPGPGVNGGSNIIAPGQGFFVEVGAFATGTLTMDNSVRTNSTTPYLKSSVSNYVKLAAIGNDKTDEMVVRFDENATALFDGQYDGTKLAAGDISYPQIYSVAERNLAYNALPETEWVQLGFKAGISGKYTISATEINDISSVWLEDTFTGVFTNLTVDSYSFIYTVDDNEARFIVHFTPLTVGENAEEIFNIYSYGNEVYVYVPENTKGNIVIYNIIGQEVINAPINNVLNKITLEKSAYYIVKVLSDESMVTKKVFIK